LVDVDIRYIRVQLSTFARIFCKKDGHRSFRHLVISKLTSERQSARQQDK